MTSKMIKKSVKKNNTYKKKTKFKFKKIFLFFAFVIVFIFGLYHFCTMKISNIYISGNRILSEQEIIEIAKISDYPNTFLNSSSKIKSRLKKNIYIKDAKVTKKWFSITNIQIEENTPLFYNEPMKETVLLDGNTINEKLLCPILINFIPDTLYSKFVIKMSQLNPQIIDRISEIKYDRNEVDETRFSLSMDDGNYVYLSLSTFEKINNYVNIIKSVGNPKGILYLDSGEYFEVVKK